MLAIVGKVKKIEFVFRIEFYASFSGWHIQHEFVTREYFSGNGLIIMFLIVD